MTRGADLTPYQSADAYARNGWRVLPIIPGDKRPPMGQWQFFATTDTNIVRQWYTNIYPGHGVGIATGAETGLFVIDIDISEGKHGDETLRELETEHGPLPETVHVQTGTGGSHYYYRYPTDGREIRNNAGGKLGPGIDIRGEGGQVVAPPTVHPCGTPYRFTIGNSPDDIGVADAPEWLLDIIATNPLAPATHTPPPAAAENLYRPEGDPESIAAAYNNGTTWADLLTADGWTHDTTLSDGEQRWRRPGKTEREGISATVGHQGRDILTVFTSSVPGLTPDTSYTRFGYTAAVHHNGDRSAAARHMRQALNGPRTDPRALIAPHTPATPNSDPVAALTAELVALYDPRDILIKWADFWQNDAATEEWVAWPFIPAARSVAFYAPAKTGKSLIMLDIAAAAATGRSIMGRPAQPPIDMLYTDYEMTEADLMERLEDMGYGPETDLTHLHYASLPNLPPLDTRAGADALLALALACNAKAVVIDTMSRAVQGDENDADTFRSYYMNTGIQLKAAGIAVVRLDHAGKDAEKGQRGSSAKNDDVDVVFRLTRVDDGLRATATHRRIKWVPETVNIRILNDPLRHVADEAAYLWPAGTKECADNLTRLGVALDASVRTAKTALTDAGVGRKSGVVAAACKYRKAEFDPQAIIASNDMETHGGAAAGAQTTPRTDSAGDAQENSLPPAGNTRGTRPNSLPNTPETPPKPPTSPPQDTETTQEKTKDTEGAFPESSGTRRHPQTGNAPGNAHENSHLPAGNTPGNAGNTNRRESGNASVSYKETLAPADSPPTPTNDDTGLF